VLALACALAAGSVSASGDTLRQLRFSPDGQHVLAQDSSGITLLSVQPLAVLFLIPARLAGDAQFTPDSRAVVFVSSPTRPDRQPPAGGQRVLLIRSPPHVERWQLAGHVRADSPEIPAGCGTQALSPDGRTLACEDFGGTLRLIDVASGNAIFEKKRFVKLIPLYNILPSGSVDLPNGQFLGDLGGACMHFSPDGRFLLAVPCGGEGRKLAYDLHERSAVKLGPDVSRVVHGNCVFIAPHRLLAPFRFSNARATAKLMAFPSGKALSKLTIPPGPLFQAADPGFILIRPFGKHAFLRDPNAGRAAAMELSSGDVIISETPALDVLGRYYVAEPSPGTVGLYERGKGLQATVVLHEK